MSETHTASLTIHFNTLGDAATPETLTSYLSALKNAFERDDRVINYSVSHDDGDNVARVEIEIYAADADEAEEIVDQIDQDTFETGGW